MDLFGADSGILFVIAVRTSTPHNEGDGPAAVIEEGMDSAVNGVLFA